MNADGVTQGVRLSTDLLDLWGHLVTSTERPTPNVEPARFLAVTQALGAEPAILEMKDYSGCRGLIIARRERMRVTRRIGYLTLKTPYLDTLIVVYGGLLGEVAHDALERNLLTVLSGPDACEHVMLNMLPTHTDLYARLARRAGVLAQPPAPHWMQELQDSFERTMARHSGKHRRRLRWEHRKLEDQFNGQLEYVLYTKAEVLDKVLTLCEQIAAQTYHAKVGTSVSKNDLWRAQLSCSAAAEQMRAHFLIGDSRPIAFVLGWNEHKRFHVVAMAHLAEYSQYSPGKHLLLRAIERACEDRMAWVDYGFGDAEYKRIYATHNWTEATVHIYGGGFRARLAYVLDVMVTSVDNMAKRLAGTSISSRIKRIWRIWMRPTSG